MAEAPNLLFLCTGNSCRSQMAEGLCRHLRGDEINAFSAGIEKHGLNPLAVKVMREIGIDISSSSSVLILLWLVLEVFIGYSLLDIDYSITFLNT